jgi:hypothetical protein
MMKKLLLTGLMNLAVFSYGQKLYTKISDSKVNQERLKVAESFINQYIEKCKNKDYTAFDNFIIAKRIEKKVNEGFENNCKSIDKVKVLGFNSAHILDYTKNDDPLELFIFDISYGDQKELKYISTWIYHDKNVIDGLWVSKEKPLYRRKKKEGSELAK